MIIGLIGKKCGMTRVFTPEGESIPVTVILATPNRVTQVKTLGRDGYRAVQVTAGNRRASRISKPMAKHFSKAGVGAGELLLEFRLDHEPAQEIQLGSEFTVDLFQEGQAVDVQGITKGKGFAGTVKRHHFSMQDATHGNSLSHRAPGSTGQRQTPGRVFKGKKMAGHLGAVTRTIQNQKIVKVDKERNLLFVKGGIPGAPNNWIVITRSVKERTGG